MLKADSKYFEDDAAHDTICEILKSSLSKLVNDVTEEGEGDDRHIIVTVDTGDGYRSVRVDVTDLGPDYLEHE